MPGTYSSRATAKFWIMPRTGTALVPVNSTAAGVTATKGFNLVADLIGGLPELDDQIGGAMVATSGQARAEYVATRRSGSSILRRGNEGQPRRASRRQIRSEPGRCSLAASSIDRPDNAAPWRVEIEYASGDTVIFDVQFGNRKTMPAVGVEGDDAITGLSLTFMPTGTVTYS